jgi:hypothetical protein
MLGSPIKPAGGEPVQSNGVIVGASYHNDTSRPLRDIEPAVSKGKPNHEANENPGIPAHHEDSLDQVVQDPASSLRGLRSPSMPATTLNFDGIAFPGVVCFCAPPDTDGEVGLTQFVQIVNLGYQVFNKTTGASEFGPVDIATVWSGFGGVCENFEGGDPIVIYDQIANRWLISQFAGTSVPTDECVAISTTSDATGPYNRYGFHLGTNFFDYPKIGVWPDAYYMSMNVFNSSGTAFLGPQPFAFDRAKMLAGLPATFVSTGITGGPSEDPFLPADLDGSTLPAAGAPETFVEFPGSGFYKVYHFHADFAVPGNSTFTLAASPPAAGFTQLCPTSRSCVPQLDSPDGLDGIGDRLMHRLAYRRFGTSESVVGNFSVLSAGVSGIRWFELGNVTSGPVTINQESTYQPDTAWRWMGSVAMDNQANLAIGYSASSSSIFPQIRYAGRLAGDTINTLGQGEAHLFDGTGSQLDTVSRWGDYSAMSVDPVDDCTFWYTQEYYSTTDSFNWRTRIGNFKFGGCTAPATGTAHFAVTICDGGAPLPNALVSIDGSPYGATLADGTYDATLPPGPHTFSVSKATFGTVSGSFSISTGVTTNLSVCLHGVPVIVAAGSTLGAESCHPANGVIDPHEAVAVLFTLMNTGGASTTNLVATLQASGGVTPISGPQSYGVIAPGGSASKPFTFIASGICGGTITATLKLQDGPLDLGTVSYTFTLGAETVALSENFDGVVAPALPAGWTATNASGSAPLWATSSSGTPAPPFDTAPNAASIDDPGSISDKRLESPSFAITTTSAQLTFRNNYTLENTFDGGVLEIAIGAGAFTDILAAGGSFVTGGYNGTISTFFGSPIAGRSAWTDTSGGFITTTVNLPAAAAGNNVKLRWRMGSDDSVSRIGWRVDTIKVTDGFICCGPQVAAAGTSIVAENCPPPNGAIDPGERVTVAFCVKNFGTGNTIDMVGTLQATGGVALPSGPQDYGVVTPGGTVCRNFTFTANGTCGGTITASIQLQDGAIDLGTVTYTFTLGVPTTITALSEAFDGVVAPALPAGWTTAATGVEVPWVTSTTNPSSAPNDAFAPDEGDIGNTELVTPSFAVPAGGAQLTFQNLYNMESTFDGMVLEISINGGAFQDITAGGNGFIAGGYNATISPFFGSPIAGRRAWSGLSAGTSASPAYITSTINMPAAANGQNVRLKWRAASDDSFTAAGAAGVRIDSISVSATVFVCCVLPPLTELSPANVWVGLANSDDVGIRFDLFANVYINGAVVGSGHLDSVAAGSSGFNNAKLNPIPLVLPSPVGIGLGDTLSIQVYARNACLGSGHNSGRARLWYNGKAIDTGATRDAGSRFDATIGGSTSNYFLRSAFALSTTAGAAQTSRDVSVGGKCGPFVSFGTWTKTLP